MTLFTNSLVYDLVLVITSVIVGVITYLKWKLNYWQRRRVPTLNPSLPFGDTKDVFVGRKTLGEQFRDIYSQLKSRGLKDAGVYFALNPIYVPLDPEIIKHIMQKDFQHFVNHGNYINEKNDPLTGHLFALKDEKWRNMRVKLTPTFTSGKMKMMFQTLVDCTVGLGEIMNQATETSSPVDIKEVLGRFTTDIIGSCAFGIKCNSLKDPDAEFRFYGKKIFEIDAVQKIKFFSQFVFPHSFLDAIKFKVVRPDVEKFFMKVIQETVDHREKNKIFRKDFMHLLIQLKNRGKVGDDDAITDVHGKTGEKALTMNELAAQSFVFFVAGFETSSTTMTFALYELATNPEIQDKLREEINTVLSKHDDQLTYDAIMEMKYLDKVLNETLRKHPPVPILTRNCSKNYKIPHSSIEIEKDQIVFIPLLGLHYDPEYYPDPEKFDPERFSEENKNSRPAFTWLPFGEGPRACIGLRFGLLQSKVGLTALLKNYKITLSNKTRLPLELDKNVFITSAKGGIWLDVEKLN